MAALYTLRLATQNPDVTWDRKNNPEPWQKYAEKQYKVNWTVFLVGFTHNFFFFFCVQFYVPSGFKPSQAPKFEE